MPDVIIIGAGVIGTSIAFNLAKKGCKDIVVLEKDRIGSGSTARCAGGVRQQFSTEPNVRLSIESIRFFERFEEETGQPADFRQYGYLLLANSETELQVLRQNIVLQRSLGVQVELLGQDDILKLVPGLQVNDIRGAAFCHTDGYADPYSVVSGFTAAARKAGVKIYEETEVTGITLNKNRITGVVTSSDKFDSPVVVNAAGPYAGIVGSMSGLKLPVSPVRRHIIVSGPVVDIKEKFQRLPMVVEFGSGLWFRREGQSVLFGMRDPHEQPGMCVDVNWDYLPGVVFPAAGYRLPLLSETGIRKAEAGLHCDTSDYNAILGQIKELPGLYIACGFSGHGFMHSPAVGRLMADLILGGPSSLYDIEPFSLERFNFPVEQKENAFI
jgi:sarcosine oxidase subunit beta